MRFDVKQALAALAVVAVAGGGLAVRELTAGEPAATKKVSNEQGISATGQELLTLLDSGREGTYRARYQIKGMQGTGIGAPWLDVFRKGRARYRQDASATESERGGQQSYVVDGTVTRCVQNDLGPWTCERVTGATDRPDQLVENLREEMRGAHVTGSGSRAIAGREARCFTISTTGEPGTEVCVDGAGVPVLVSYGEHAIELVSLTPVVTDRDFVPPGQVRTA